MMKFVTLDKVAKIDRMVASDEECATLPYVGLEHIEKNTGHLVADFAGNPELLLATKFKFTPKHILYGKLRPYLNKVGRPTFEGVCTTEILPLLPFEEELDRTYLWALLISPHFVAWASSKMSGANLPRLDPKLLAMYRLPLPPLPEQKRIAAILEKADRLRRQRRYALELSNTYLQSVFLEMFGDPATNPMGWNRVSISELGTVQTGNTPSRDVPENYGDYIEWIKSDNIVEGLLYITKSKEQLSELGARQGRIIEPMSLLITCIAGSPTTIGNVALTNRRVAFNQQINAITPNNEINPFFLYGMFLVAKPLIQHVRL
jgi:type I restriction enzyme S subunit